MTEIQERGNIMVRIDPDLKELIPHYLENRIRDVGAISAALGNSDFESIRILGHGMKGSGEGYGFETITEIGRAIEAAAKEGNAEEIRRRGEELRCYVERVEILYE